MKFCGLLVLLFLAILACSGGKSLTIEEKPEQSEEDSVSYELIVLDPGFENWFITRAQPSNMRNQSYYESWNERYVDAWNVQRVGFRYSQLIHGNIDYDRNTDYGLEINHKLFYYFMYVENVLKIQLVPNGPRVF